MKYEHTATVNDISEKTSIEVQDDLAHVNLNEAMEFAERAGKILLTEEDESYGCGTCEDALALAIKWTESAQQLREDGSHDAMQESKHLLDCAAELRQLIE